MALALTIAMPPAAAQDFDWVAGAGGPGNEFVHAMAVAGDGSSYTVGYFQQPADFDPGPGTATRTPQGPQDGYLLKLDASGGFVYALAIGGAQADTAFDVAVDAAGSVYVVGEFRGTFDFDPGPGTFELTAAGTDTFVFKLDAAGDLVWVRQIAPQSGNAVAVDAAGNVIVAGWFWNTADLDPGPGVYTVTAAGTFPERDMYVVKLDPNGDFVWADQAGGGSVQPTDLATDSAGGVLVTGFFDGTVDFDLGGGGFPMTVSGQDLFLLKLDAAGLFEWARQLAPGSAGNGVVFDGSDAVLATGYFSGSADFGAGAGPVLTAAGGQDPFVWKLDAAGQTLWARHAGSDASEYGWGLAVDAAGSVYATGAFQKTVDFDPGPDVHPLTSGGSQDPFVWKLTGDGDLDWAVRFGGSGQNDGRAVGVDPSGGVYVAGKYFGNADFDPGAGAVNLTSAGLWDQFVVRLGQPQQGCTASELVKLTALTGAAFEQLGISTALDGDTAVVGSAPHNDDPGSGLRTARLFERNAGGPGNWGEVAELASSDAAPDDWFGFSVEVDGDLVVVGAQQGSGIAAGTGAAYVFERDAGGLDNWGEVVKLYAADGTAGERYGWSVAANGDTVAVGAIGGWDASPWAGEVYVYRRDAGGPGNWGLVAQMAPPPPSAQGDDFGLALALDGDLLAVGSPGDDDLGERSGSVYVYRRDAGGPEAWGLVAKLLADDGAAWDDFGRAVALDGETLLVGAYLHDGVDVDSGAVYVFERHLGGPDNWGQKTEIFASDGATGEAFGNAVAIAGDVALVGALADDDAGPHTGAAYVFERDLGSPGGWGESNKLLAGDAEAGDTFGKAVAIAGSTLLIGAHQEDAVGFQGGTAYVFACVDESAATDADGDGWDDGVDCDDADPAIHPGAAEACNGLDDNCDGQVDEGLDADGDGTADCFDGCPADPSKLEPGVCGCGTADTDGDGDGVFDCLDGCPLDPNKSAPGVCGCGVVDDDTDGDGTADCLDSCPADPAKLEPGACGCGVADVDTDGDGAFDCVDGCPADPAKNAPGLCGCGVADADGDGDGAADCVDLCPADPGKIDPGVCGCGVADTDGDGDGTADCVDLCPADPGKTDPGVCGCGVADTDGDGDGAADCVDLCPADPAKVDPGICGCGVADADGDGDGAADCVDACVDSDLQPTVVVAGCDSGAANPPLAEGCTLADRVLLCAAEATNHGRFVSCVAHLTRDAKKAGVIDGAEKGAIDACAAQADVP